MIRRTTRTYVASALCVAAAGCILGGGGGQLPETSYVASGSTPEPLRIDLAVPATQAVVRERAIRVLTDSQFRISRLDTAAVRGYSLRRLVMVHIDLLPPTAPGQRPKQSSIGTSRLVVSGESYLGDESRRDSISALPERWRLVTPSDAGAITLRSIARAIQLEIPAPSAGYRDDTVRVGLPVDSTTAVRLLPLPVGRTADLCLSSTALPSGWIALYWFADQTRCPPGAQDSFPGEPNMVRVEHEW
jgi:hypothetical protein